MAAPLFHRCEGGGRCNGMFMFMCYMHSLVQHRSCAVETEVGEWWSMPVLATCPTMPSVRKYAYDISIDMDRINQ